MGNVSAYPFSVRCETQCQLTTAAPPVAGGSVTPATGSFFPAGSVQNISATANSGFTFANWTGPVASASSASTTVTMTGPITETANFNSSVGITVTTSPAGRSLSAGG